MDRRRSTQILTALYGMDTHHPDWTPVLGAVSHVFRATQVSVHRFDSERRQSAAAGAFDESLTRNPFGRPDGPPSPWFSLLHDRLRRDGLVSTAELPDTAAPTTFPPASPPGHDFGLAFCMHEDRAGELTVLSVTRRPPATDYDDDERALARSLLPHLRNVCTWQRRFDSLDNQSERFRIALDALAEGVLMLDKTGRPVFCNAAARSMACHHLFAWKSDGRLGLIAPGDEQLLHRALRQFGTNETMEPVLLQIHSYHGHLVATLKLCLAASPEGGDSPVRTLAFIKLLEPIMQPTLVPGLKAQWGFTDAEAHLAQQLMRGLSLDDAARRISVTKNTVRTQLRSLFMKTETHRQADLVRVLLKLSHG